MSKIAGPEEMKWGNKVDFLKPSIHSTKFREGVNKKKNMSQSSDHMHMHTIDLECSETYDFESKTAK